MIVLDGREIDGLVQFLRQPAPGTAAPARRNRCAPRRRAAGWSGPSRTRPVGEAAITSFSASSAATMRCTVERARSTRWAIWPRLKPVGCSSSARRIEAARAITCTWLLSPCALLIARFSPSASRSDLSSHVGLRLDTRPAACRGLPAGSRIDTLQPKYGTENNGRERPRTAWSRRSHSKSTSCVPALKTTGGRPWPTSTGRARRKLYRSLTDFGEQRLQAMDRPASRASVLSIAGPGVQVERDAATARPQGARVERFPRHAKSRSGPTAIPASLIWRCRTPRPPPTSSSAACAS